ncbi:MAG TPA: CHAT domain-containing protein, partial [Pyrinomonadaceae bacterium]|nr:CHAT domain-containing protein [Pyrinomonadaceae bacterium]
ATSTWRAASHIEMSRIPHMLLVVLLSVAPVAQARPAATADNVETARRIASETDDNVTGLTERQEALRRLQDAARQLIDAGETIEAARALNRAGRLQLKLSAPQDAVRSHLEAAALVKQKPSVEVEVDSLNGLGTAYLEAGNREKSEQALRRALSLSEQANYLHGRAEALFTLGYKQNLERHPDALDTAQKSLKLWDSLDDRQGRARAYFQVARCLMSRSMLAEAVQNFQQALALWREVSDLPEQAETLIMLSYIELRRGDWQNAISLLTQAQSLIDERAEPVKAGQIALGLAEAFIENGLPEISLTHYERALTYYRQAREIRGEMAAVRSIGATYYFLGDYPNATAQLKQALALASAHENNPMAALSHEFLGRVYSATGEHKLASEHLHSALASYTQSFNPNEATRVRALLGQVYEQQGQTEPARRHYLQALQTFTKLSDRLNQAAVYYRLGRLELASGNYDAAEDYLRRSIEVTEKLRSVSKSSDLAAAFSATVYERYEKYVECLMRKHESQPGKNLAVRAFEASESARARSLAEMLRTSQTNLLPDLDPSLVEQEKSLRQSLRVKEDNKISLLSRSYKAEELAALEAQQAQLEAEYKQVAETIRTRYPAYEQITEPVAWSLSRIQEEVVADEQTLLLEYSLGETKSYVWAVTRGGLKSYELPARHLVSEAARKVYQLLSSPPRAGVAGELTQAVDELGRMILSPVASELARKRRVIVVADGALNYIPFQILSASTATGNDLLVSSHDVINAPSASIAGELLHAAARRQPAPKLLAAFGDPAFKPKYEQQRADAREGAELASAERPDDGRWRSVLRDIQLNGNTFDPSVVEPLFYARRELSNLLDLAAGGENILVSDYAATRENLLKADLSQYSILHFATHGFLDPKRPENSGLLLSTVTPEGKKLNGFVGLQDIYELRAPVDLVVLSACQTSLGKNVRGEGLIGLTRGFMYAGAFSVVASLWKVDDEATAELMKEFYTNMLQKGLPPAAALRAAQNSIRLRPQWRSPYYWAAFTLQGESRRPLKHLPPASTTAFLYERTTMGSGLLVLLAGLAFLYRRRKSRHAHASA